MSANPRDEPPADTQSTNESDAVVLALAEALRPVVEEVLSSIASWHATDTEGDRWLSPAEAARRVGVDRRTIYRALSAGTLRGGRVTTERGCNRWRVRTTDIDAWLDAGANTADLRPERLPHELRPGLRAVKPPPPSSSYRRRVRRTQPTPREEDQ